MKFKLLCLLFWSNLSFNQLKGQSITPYALNNGGGFSATMDWSMGESASIAHFVTNGYSLNTGVLQPLTNIVTTINEYGPSVFGNKIAIGPNPATNFIILKARFNEVGNLSLQLLDAKLALIVTHESGTIYSSYEKNLPMSNYPSGVYYLKVYFKPISGAAKTGIYKIIKL